jgi:hypothetical protein
VIPDFLIQSHSEEPAEQEVVVDLLNKLPIATDRVDDHQQLGLEQLFRRNRRPTGRGIDAVKELVHSSQGFIGHFSDGSQWMIFFT